MRYLAGFIFLLFFTPASVSSAELVMFDSQGCEWCEAWDEEVGIIYDKTDEAKMLPLLRMDIDDERKGALTKIRPVMYTPTFVVMDNGQEVGRILGYPGEENFWGMLNVIISKMNASVNGCLDVKPQSGVPLKTQTC